MPHLRVVLGRLPGLREGYRQCARGSRTAADRAMAFVCVALRKDRVSRLLDQILATYGRNASTWTTVPPRSFVREEAELSREFGFRPGKARKHIKAMYNFEMRLCRRSNSCSNNR
ncbi:hypothetical protein Acsp03_68490 [Actinomadura sp. NBRC 104412]|uniref:hypothetical protein n=1 Tax=Actinomadura sp. NBRC 104412 TaxID=3032203 RepID=UPI0024A416D6|nr:hypothetical protein [Actinomadura sp. NBRC 104412]GLZ09383.1 hypothetical protein Acsp03_68490 [Actinomadura sp. NBRC 104412]